MSADVCGYTFDPANWARQHGQPAAVDTEWSCHRESEDGHDYCRFHMDPADRKAEGITEDDLRASFRDEVVHETQREPTFIGATLHDVDFSRDVVDRPTNTAIDLRHTTIDGDVRMDHAIVQQQVLFGHAQIIGETSLTDATVHDDLSFAEANFSEPASFENATFEDDTSFRKATFEGETTFKRATFDGEADFYRSRFREDVSFEKSAWKFDSRFQDVTFEGSTSFFESEFNDRADFRDCVFEDTAQFSMSGFDNTTLFLRGEFRGAALFKRSKFDGETHFQSTTFESETSFSEATFDHKAKFQFASFEGEASLSYIQFNNATHLLSAEFLSHASFFESNFEYLADFRNASFEDVGRFEKARFESEAYFDYAEFERATFEKAIFEKRLSFVDTSFESNLSMKECRIDTCRFVNVETSLPSVTIDLERGSLEAGKIVQTVDDDVFYNLRDGCLGAVDVEMADQSTMFEKLYLYRTEYDGFDFSDYRYTLTPDWVLHRFAGPLSENYDHEAERYTLSETEPARTPPGGTNANETHDSALVEGLLSEVAFWRVSNVAPDRENTYLKAKNGASQVGDSRAASHFFIKEMYYRRQSHLLRLRDSAERLGTRIRLLALVLMNVFMAATCGYGEKPRRTIGFSVLLILVFQFVYALTGTPSPYDSSFGYLLLSIQSFTSLVFGQSASVPGFVGSFVVAVEGFIGAFMIGLFVFGLTRSIHR